MEQTNILNEIVTITNISRGLINENRAKVNIIDTLLGINETIISIETHINDLFSAKIFFLLNSKSMIHHTRLRTLLKQMQHVIILIREYLNIHSTGKLTPNITDPIHLERELIKINKLLPQQLALLENPRTNIWHYYRFLTATPMNHDNKLILIMRIPLIDLNSSMTPYKIYNLPMYH